MISAFLINSLAASKNNEQGREGGKARGGVWSWQRGPGAWWAVREAQAAARLGDLGLVGPSFKKELLLSVCEQGR